MNKVIIFILVFTSVLNALSLDKKVSKDESGIIGAHYDVPKYSFIATMAFAAYEGSETRFGKASWRSIDSAIISQAITEGVKKATGRLRPRHTDSPNDWNKGGESFPSGHVSGMTAIVTPYILEYKKDYPLIQLLWLLPIHQMIGRIKAQAHWQSDVIAGVVVGYASGYIAHNMKNPMLLYFSKDKAYIGLKYRF
jgi:membrane-associated phospholipid phosphatase